MKQVSRFDEMLARKMDDVKLPDVVDDRFDSVLAGIEGNAGRKSKFNPRKRVVLIAAAATLAFGGSAYAAGQIYTLAAQQKFEHTVDIAPMLDGGEDAEIAVPAEVNEILIKVGYVPEGYEEEGEGGPHDEGLIGSVTIAPNEDGSQEVITVENGERKTVLYSAEGEILSETVEEEEEEEEEREMHTFTNMSNEWAAPTTFMDIYSNSGAVQDTPDAETSIVGIYAYLIDSNKTLPNAAAENIKEIDLDGKKVLYVEDKEAVPDKTIFATFGNYMVVCLSDHIEKDELLKMFASVELVPQENMVSTSELGKWSDFVDYWHREPQLGYSIDKDGNPVPDSSWSNSWANN